ncbi:hypothetical protein NM688_g4545 [Phlebia brevispora]|uniref:Uncharacterized protein n=1 Tax=Phlebia brevispora TaxID=194682 RepID=A0ACC1T2L6_9APHY|nr:hypothetical protein NM688_g4545 [Phlebia brevispora]
MRRDRLTIYAVRYEINTHASTQQKKIKPSAGPAKGIKRSDRDTTTDVKTIIIRYADVAIELSMPVYVEGDSATAREPCCKVKARLASPVHQKL